MLSTPRTIYVRGVVLSTTGKRTGSFHSANRVSIFVTTSTSTHHTTRYLLLRCHLLVIFKI